jgi:hypothetical protein
MSNLVAHEDVLEEVLEAGGIRTTVLGSILNKENRIRTQIKLLYSFSQ